MRRRKMLPHKLNQARFFKLKHALCFEFSGKDVRRYLNARLTNDIRSLKANECISAAALNPQGRTEGYFRVICLDETRFVLVCDGGDLTEVSSALLRYKVADRVDCKDLTSELAVIHLFSLGSGPLQGFDKRNLTYACLNHDRLGTPGLDCLISKEQEVSFIATLRTDGLQEYSSSEWEFLRISTGRPSFPIELSPESLFAEADLRDSVSFTKGCYVGQEVVEKVDSHGRTGRRLARLQLEAAIELSAETEVIKHASDGTTKKSGEIISSAANSALGQTVAFASLRNEELSAGQFLTVADRTVKIL